MEYTGMMWKTRQNILEDYGNCPELDGKVWKLAETTSIVQNLGLVNSYSYPCCHARPCDLWCQMMNDVITLHLEQQPTTAEVEPHLMRVSTSGATGVEGLKAS